MKKVKFVSGFNAKMALAACAVAGLTLTSCEKEDFNVDVPNINIDVPEVNFPTDNPEAGVAYIVLSTTSTSGAILADVTYTVNDEELGAGVTTYQVTPEQTITVTAACTGYYTNSQEVVIPAVPNDQMLTVPVNVVLTPVQAEDIIAVTDPSTAEPADDAVKNQVVSGTFEPGEIYTVNVPVPDATPYITEEQKAELYSAVDALQGPDQTRALGDDLEVAKDMLRAKIADYQATPSMNNSVACDITVTAPASNITLTVTTATETRDITLTANVNGADYSVTGKCTVAGASVVTAEAEGVDVSHGHGHGNGDNQGGGTGE